MNYKILNKKDTRKIIATINDQFDIGEEFSKELLDSYTYLLNKDARIYVSSINWELLGEKDETIRINNFGMYFGKFDSKRDIKLSMEGCRIVRPHAKKNVVKVNEFGALEWFKGENIPINKEILELNDNIKPDKAFVMLRFEDEDIGCGKMLDFVILNQITKSRRISAPYS